MKSIIVQQLNNVYQEFNKLLFDERLPTVDFLLVPRKKLVCRFMPGLHLIEIGGDLSHMDSGGILLHLLHELVHISNYVKGVVDCRHRYHNKAFLIAALETGLTVAYDNTHGWGLTMLNSVPRNLKNVLYPNPDFKTRLEQIFETLKFDKWVLRLMKKEVDLVKPRQTYFLKYSCQCPSPHNSIRSGRRPDGEHPLKIKCMECNSDFKCVLPQN